MAATIHTESATSDCNISPRDAVRREALKYFSSNPGFDSLPNNISMHGQARRVLSTEAMTIEDLSRVSLGLFCRNTLNDMTQTYLEAMEVAPLCEFSEFHSSLAIGKELRDLGVKTGLTHVIHDVDLFVYDRLGGFRPYNKPVDFLEQSILAAGILPGDELDKKLAMAKPIKDKQTVLYSKVSAMRTRLRDSCPGKYVCDHPELLPLCCDMSREFEHEKRETRSKLYYYSDTKKDAYDILHIMGIEPNYMFEQFGMSDWFHHAGVTQGECQGWAIRALSEVEHVLPSMTPLERKTNRYIVSHMKGMDVGLLKVELGLVRKALEEKAAVAQRLKTPEHSQSKAH